MRALEDAVRINDYYMTNAPHLLQAQKAEDFVRWTTMGTEFAWISSMIGERKDRPY
jgi:hypothetical protein